MGNVRVELLDLDGLVAHVLVGHGDGALANERRLSGQHLVEHDPERIDVAAGVDVVPLGLFR